MPPAGELHPSTPETPQRQEATAPAGAWGDDFVSNYSNGEARGLIDVSPRHEKSGHAHVEKGSPRTPNRSVADGLREWSESPISPRQRSTPNRGKEEERENWDDDFLDSSDTPAKPSTSTPAGSHDRHVHRFRMSGEAEEENWDDEFELGFGPSSPGAGPSTRSKRLRRERGRDRDVAWDLSDDENDFDREMGLDRHDEEDKTVTARSRRKPLGSIGNDIAPLPSLPSLPPLPNFLPTIPSGDAADSYTSPPSPFPRSSPSHSVFSIPGTTTSGHRDRDSTYGSTAHLALSLRRTHSAESSPSSPRHRKIINPDRFPQGSEAPRERRRLRKKSRPPHLDSSILELDDKLGPEPTFHRPTTPDPRPCTPPSNIGVSVNLPTAPSDSAQASSSHPAPMSPTSASKSPLLARIGSMRRWGRKRNSTATGHEELSVEHSEQRTGSSPTTRGGPQKIPSTKAFDAEADRFDNNRTPRPRSHVVATMSPLSTMPPHSTVDIGDVPQTPSRNRFFRGSPNEMDKDTSISARPSLTIDGQDLTRGKSRERERLRLAIPTAVPMATQSSQSGESELAVNISPRRARIRAFGQRLLPSKRSTSASSPERAKESSEEESSRTSSQGIGGHRQASTPLSGETPTRLRSRIPGTHHGSSSLGKTRPIFPRHVSGSALHENRSRTSPVPSMSASGRSVSATDSAGTAASSDDLTHSEKESDEKGGHRGFMGSLRRISLASAHAQHQRQQRPTSSHFRPRSPILAIPPVPTLPLLSDSPSRLQAKSSPGGLTGLKSAVHTSISAAADVDLASPASDPLRDWLSSPPRSGEPLTLSHSKSSSFATSSSPLQNTSLSRVGSTSQTASLGRASPLPIGTGTSGNLIANGGANVFRRSSLGDLKIPSRISRAQDGLKRDLGRVREFAARVEEMQELRASYFMIATQIQGILDAPRSPSRAASPTSGLFGISRSNSRARSNTNPPPPCIDYRSLALGFRVIDSKYSIAWECADLLIELGTGNVIESTGQAAGKTDSELLDGRSSSHGKNRERAVTLSGEEGKPDFALADVVNPKSPPGGSPPAIVSWRALKGRHDLGHRQLYLLKEMLNNAEPAKEGIHLDIPGALTEAEWAAANKALESSLTLPTDESVAMNPPPGSASKKRTSRLVGIRDMLRSLKRSTARALQGHHEAIVMQSSTTLNTESSFDSQPRHIENHPYGYNTIAGIPSKPGNGRRKSETNAALVESMRSPGPDYSPLTGRLPLTHKSSPRRPSLASLFRLGQKHRSGAASSMDLTEQSNNTLSNEVADIATNTTREEKVNFADTSREGIDDDTEDSDWDRMDSMSDVDVQMAAIADESATQGSTMKLRKKKQHNRLSMPPMTRPITPKYDNLPFNASQGSFATPDQSLSNVRCPRLPNVDENNVSMSSTGSAVVDVHQTPASQDSSRRSHSRSDKDHDREKQFSSVRAVPAKSSKGIPSFDAPAAQFQSSPNFRLAMTPENIKPLLENARVVTSRLHDCLAEVKGLLLRAEGTVFTFSGSVSSSHVAL